jgi:CRISPR/Cas system-associated protein Cas10 (large subunit of type III CRISPR-Cas system)
MDTYTTNSGMEGEKMSNLHQWLVCFDTDQIKQYLLATNRLKEIRGGSALIAQLDVERKNDLERCYGENNVVYSAGGGAAVLVPTEQEAQALIAKIEREFRARTVTASITGVYLPVDPTPGRFGAEMARASRELRRAKASKAELACLPVEPYLRLCDSCGNHPAARRAQDGSGDWLCLTCFRKREEGREARAGFFANFVAWSQSESWQKAPDDLDAIGALASPPGYVGFIALDGNHVGDLLTELPTIEEYRKFSEGLWKLVQEQTFKSLEKHCAPRDGIAPFEIVLIGGDDVLLITSADVAMKVALDIVQGFEEASQQLLQEVGLSGKRAKLTMAGGVVLAHADFPIPAMHTLAEALQKSAKRLCAKQKYQTGAIDFQVVTSSDTDLDAMRQGVPHRRPYTLGDLRDLLYHIRQLKDADMPTNQLHAMYQALFEGAVKAQLASIATLGHLGRSKDKIRYNRLRQFFERFGVQLDGQLPPWDVARGKEEKRLVSALTDLVELYPFIR